MGHVISFHSHGCGPGRADNSHMLARASRATRMPVAQRSIFGYLWHACEEARGAHVCCKTCATASVAAYDRASDNAKNVSVKTFFATAGIPPHDYGQLYGGMQEPIRRSLHQKFKEHGRAFGLTENRMFLEQFVRESGCQQESINHNLFLHELSCVDAAEVVIALLSAVPASLSGSRLDGLPQTADGNIDHIAVHERERQANVENFWRAFDAVLTKDPAPLREGIAEAQEMAKHVESLARLLKDSKSVHSTRQFRWCKIEQPPQACFRHPLAIRRLAVWMLDVLFTYRPKADVGADRPLLVIVRDRVRDTYVCVGATPMKLQEPDDFGNKFRTALRAADSFKYRYDFFDKSCIEIAAEDFDRFWDVLSASHL